MSEEIPSFYERTLDCVHCGLCIYTCPTYRILKKEQDSPRGRIYLARAMAEGRLDPSKVLAGPFNLCLDCRACESECPSGVLYHLVLEDAKERISKKAGPGLSRKAVSLLVEFLFTRPRILGLSFDLLSATQTLGLRKLMGRILPGYLRYLNDFLPSIPERKERKLPPPLSRPGGKPKARVALFTGCVMTEVFGRVHHDTVYVLNEYGVEVVVPRKQFCCGAISFHFGSRKRARKLAKLNLQAFPDDADFIVFNSAGCGAMLKDYGRLFNGTPLQDEAKAFSAKARDVTELLAEIGLMEAPREVKLKVAYDDPCHLLHGQGIGKEPREALGTIPGLELVDFDEPERCCGAAGIYNLLYPETARILASWKARDILQSRAEAVCTGNPGCMLQVRYGLKMEKREDFPVYHPMELLASAWGMERK